MFFMCFNAVGYEGRKKHRTIYIHIDTYIKKEKRTTLEMKAYKK